VCALKIDLDAIRERDRKADVCLTCRQPDGGPHGSTVEECNAGFISRGQTSRCANSKDHHAYVPGGLREWGNDAEQDRRDLLAYIDGGLT
jgi:hypothetical protein